MAAPALHLAWVNPVRIHWGAGCFQELSAQMPVVVLADRAALSYENETLLLERLGHHCKAWSWFQGGLASVQLVQTLCQEIWPVLCQHPQATVLAIGGGSTLDLAKVLRYRLDDAHNAVNAWRSNTLPMSATRHPLWLVPTTAGTGSEVTRWATLWDTEVAEPVKLSWSMPDGFAEQAWVDPELSHSCPLQQSRDCALDTLAHALESLWNRNANPITEALALDAARLVLSMLPVLLEHAGNPQTRTHEARTQLSRASLLAGLAMSQTQTALAHALSYELTLKEQMPHGEACAVWLPMVWELALGAAPGCDAALARVFNVPAPDGAQCLRNWLEKLGIRTRDLRDSPARRAVLAHEMRSARGKNFIATELEP
jgi:phosphonate metabolism-associated iron-containing alcohol dehydrogenase